MKTILPVATNGGFLPLGNNNPSGLSGLDFLQFSTMELLSAVVSAITGRGIDGKVVILSGVFSHSAGTFNFSGGYIYVPNPTAGVPFGEIFEIDPFAIADGGYSFLNVAVDTNIGTNNPEGVDPWMLTDGITNTYPHKWRPLKFTPASSGSVTAVSGSAAPSQPYDIITTIADATAWVTLQANQVDASGILNSGWATVGGIRYWKDPEGNVHIVGDLQATAAGSTAFTLPVGFRPLRVQRGVAAVTDNNTNPIGFCAQITINTNGTVVVGNTAPVTNEFMLSIPPFPTN